MNIYEQAMKGLPLKDVLIIDEHCHKGFYGPNYQSLKCTPDGVVSEMDRLGIDMACISHLASLTADCRWGNDRILDAMDTYPGRYIGYCTVNPLYPDMIDDEMSRCFARGMKGIKLHPYCHERPLSYKPYEKAYAFAAAHNSFVMAHTYNAADVANVDKFASEYPDAVFIMGHMGGEMATIEKAVDVVNRHDNVYGDIAVSASWEGIVEWFVKEIGSKKLLFGTDSPCMEGRATFCRVALAEIDEDAKRDIFGLNMKRILDRVTC